MTRPMVRIHNVETNEVIDREMNNDEFAKWEIAAAKEAAELQTIADQEAAKLALLKKMGLTADEAKLLLS